MATIDLVCNLSVWSQMHKRVHYKGHAEGASPLFQIDSNRLVDQVIFDFFLETNGLSVVSFLALLTVSAIETSE